MNTVENIFQNKKGILAADERPSSMDKRLEGVSISGGEENRNKFRTLLFETENIQNYISGIIMSTETFEDHMHSSGTPSREYLKNIGVEVGVKVDEGIKDGITLGLDTLEDKCLKYSKMGATFTKWRSVIEVSDPKNINQICEDLTEYAKVVLSHKMIPIVEPEVLRDGEHSIDESKEVIKTTLDTLVSKMKEENVDLSKIILKTSFALSGSKIKKDEGESVSKCTLYSFQDLPKQLGGIVFLSGGLTPEDSSIYLKRTSELAKGEDLNIPISFSYGRALQSNALKTWGGEDENLEKGREEFLIALKRNSEAI